MKTNHLVTLLGLSLAVCVAGTPALLAVPLTGTTAIQTKPDTKAPAIGFLNAGTDPVAATHFNGILPSGWMAVELPGPFEGYVTNNDITKNLDVIPGSAIRMEPKADATVLTTMDKADTATKGKWIQIEVKKKIVGYINLTPAASASSAMTATTASTAMPVASSSSTATVGRPAPAIDLGDGGSAALPRQFQGKFVSTRRPLAPRRPYDYQLNDEAGVRVGYLDVSKLLQTERIEKYVDRTVVVYGTAKNDADAKAVVIRAESLQLK
jgi:hypothetical protein